MAEATHVTVRIMDDSDDAPGELTLLTRQLRVTLLELDVLERTVEIAIGGDVIKLDRATWAQTVPPGRNRKSCTASGWPSTQARCQKRPARTRHQSAGISKCLPRAATTN
jgi:hypothetical protein